MSSITMNRIVPLWMNMIFIRQLIPLIVKMITIHSIKFTLLKNAIHRQKIGNIISEISRILQSHNSCLTYLRAKIIEDSFPKLFLEYLRDIDIVIEQMDKNQMLQRQVSYNKFANQSLLQKISNSQIYQGFEFLANLTALFHLFGEQAQREFFSCKDDHYLFFVFRSVLSINFLTQQVQSQHKYIIIHMPILEIFRKDRRYWSEGEVEEVELFFMLHPFFSKFYQHQDFQKVVGFTFYARVEEDQQLRLELNKKSEVMILLSGEIKIYRKIHEGVGKKRKRRNLQILHDDYYKMGEYIEPNQMIQLRSDVIVKSKSTCTSQLLFIPTLLFETHNSTVNNRKIDRVLEVLNRIFPQANKRDLKNLAESGCYFREYKMNNYIYRAGSVPKDCFILVSGNLKIQSAGFSAKRMLDMSIVGENTLFGERDLNEEARVQNVICCSAHCKVLALQRQPYNRFISRNKHLNPAYAERIKEIIAENSKNRLQKYEQKHILPRILRFHSSARPQEQEKIEKDLLQNCHMLIYLSPRKKSSSSFRSSENSHIQKDYSVNQFERKMSLYQRIKSHHPLDSSLKLF